MREEIKPRRAKGFRRGMLKENLGVLCVHFAFFAVKLAINTLIT
jgi:hypothetical protein